MVTSKIADAGHQNNYNNNDKAWTIASITKSDIETHSEEMVLKKWCW